MNPSPQGRLPKAPRRGQVAGVGDRRCGRRARAAGRSRSAQVIRASDPAVSDLGDRRALAPQALDVGAHHPREHLLGRPRAGSRSARRPRWRPCARRCARATGPVGQRTTSAAAIAAATGAGGSAACVVALGHQREHAVGAGPAGLAAQALAEPDRRRVADHQHLLAGADSEAVANHGGDRPLELGHGCGRLRFSFTLGFSWSASPPSGVNRTSTLTFFLPLRFSFLASLPFGLIFSFADPGPALLRFVFSPLPESLTSPGARSSVTWSFAVPFFLLRLTFPMWNDGPT